MKTYVHDDTVLGSCSVYLPSMHNHLNSNTLDTLGMSSEQRFFFHFFLVAQVTTL
jgi:hypothetical protein